MGYMAIQMVPHLAAADVGPGAVVAAGVRHHADLLVAYGGPISAGALVVVVKSFLKRMRS